MGEKREKQRDDRKNQILSLALTMFIERGYYGASTRAIAAQAGISSGLIFNYFQSKDEIYETLIAIGCDKMVLDYEKANQNPYSYIMALTKEILNSLESNPFFAKMFVFMDQAQHTIGISDRARKMLAQTDIVANYTKMIEKGQEFGQFRAGDAQALTIAYFAMIQGVAQERVRNESARLPKVEWMLDVLTGAKNQT